MVKNSGGGCVEFFLNFNFSYSGGGCVEFFLF